MKNNTTTKTDVINKIIDYFKENDDIFTECIEELDGWNGYLGDDRYYYMDELNELFNDQDPIEILNRAYYGYDEDSYHTDAHGKREYGEFNPNREYFHFNAYGNLVSSDYKDYSDFLDDEFIEQLLDVRGEIYAIGENDELPDLFDELEQAEED